MTESGNPPDASQDERQAKVNERTYEHKGQTVVQEYTEGKIVVFSWGYDQTNVDYFKIVHRTKRYVWLQPLAQKNVKSTGWLQGTCEPDPDRPGEYQGDTKPIKRIVQVWGNEERGIRIESYGWASLWDGNPRHWSSYH